VNPRERIARLVDSKSRPPSTLTPMRSLAVVLIPLLAVSPAVAQQAWNQWAGGPQHTGSLDVTGQPLVRELANVVVDPFAEILRAEARGALLVHYQSPLSDGSDVFMEVKTGTYTNFRAWETQTWNVRKFQWEDRQLVLRWTAESDWDPVPAVAVRGPRVEPVFHAALGKNFVYMPGAGGTILEVDRDTGAIARRLGQFTTAIDPQTYVTSPVTIDADGNLYYNAVRMAAEDPWTTDISDAWLVKIASDGTASRARYSALVTNAPAATGMCLNQFSVIEHPRPWPPSVDAVPPSVICGAQRPGINIAPAVGSDGTIYTISRAHLTPRWGWLVAVNPDLTTKWSSSLRNRFQDGCNVLIPQNGSAGGCRAGTRTGVDPADNEFGSGLVEDSSSSTPVVAPDGTIFYGAYSSYNDGRGHMMRFSAGGEFLHAYPFGWDVTPAIWQHDGTYSLITKENHYREVQYYVTQLNPELQVEWQFLATNTMRCSRDEDGTLDCVEGDRTFEWCVNSLAVDRRGVVYVNSEDGHLYAIDQGGTVRERFFLQLALGAAYTPVSLGTDGKIYTQNAGRLFVVGRSEKKRRAARP
jgi:outer membrane protein assembly factor BamB